MTAQFLYGFLIPGRPGARRTSLELKIGGRMRRVVEEMDLFCHLLFLTFPAMSICRVGLFSRFSQVAVVSHVGVASPMIRQDSLALSLAKAGKIPAFQAAAWLSDDLSPCLRIYPSDSPRLPGKDLLAIDKIFVGTPLETLPFSFSPITRSENPHRGRGCKKSFHRSGPSRFVESRGFPLSS